MKGNDVVFNLKDNASVGPVVRRIVKSRNRNAGRVVLNDDPRYFATKDPIAGTGTGSVWKPEGESQI